MSHHREVVTMAMTPEERRKRERERKARYRAEQRERDHLDALPRIGPGGRDGGGTGDGTSGGTKPTEFSNEAAAVEFLATLEVPKTSKPRAALLLTLARDLDSSAIAER
jgi:hypothetical protein